MSIDWNHPPVTPMERAHLEEIKKDQLRGKKRLDGMGKSEFRIPDDSKQRLIDAGWWGLFAEDKHTMHRTAMKFLKHSDSQPFRI